MRICIFGAGAVGGHLAVKLAIAGHDASVVARGDHLAAIQANPPPPPEMNHKPSMLQDYEKNRPMEIEALIRTPLAFEEVLGFQPRRLMWSPRLQCAEL